MPSGFDNERFRKLLRVQPWEALQTVYEGYADDLLRLSRYLTGDEEAARDIVQDAFLSVWENRRNLATFHTQPIEHYLTRIVRNRSVSFFKRRRHADIDIVLLFMDFAQDGPDNRSISFEVYQEFRREIDGLPLRQRQAITMKIDDRLSLDEIAAKLGVSRKMVEKSQLRAVRALTRWAKGHRDV